MWAAVEAGPAPKARTAHVEASLWAAADAVESGADGGRTAGMEAEVDEASSRSVVVAPPDFVRAKPSVTSRPCPASPGSTGSDSGLRWRAVRVGRRENMMVFRGRKDWVPIFGRARRAGGF
jgi:hypothetical protein